jgi:hypothetical protein
LLQELFDFNKHGIPQQVIAETLASCGNNRTEAYAHLISLSQNSSFNSSSGASSSHNPENHMAQRKKRTRQEIGCPNQDSLSVKSTLPMQQSASTSALPMALQ